MASAVTDKPKTHSKPDQAAPVVRWAFGEAPLSAGLAANLEFGQEANGSPNAAGIFRRQPGASAPTPEDRTAALLEATRPAAQLVEVGAVAGLMTERTKLVELLELCAKKAAEVQKQRDDPALLAALNFSERVKDLAVEADTITARTQEAETSLARLDFQIKQLRDVATSHIRKAVTLSVRVEAEALAGRKQKLMQEVSDRVSALFEALYSLSVTSKTPPDVERVVATLVEERFSARG
jgi:hypothetical protein